MFTNVEEDYQRGQVPFLGINVFLDSRPLVPRTETEYWVDQTFKEVPSDTSVCVLDLFAGSGCIGLAFLKHHPHAYMTFAEIESEHLQTIKKSLQENALDANHAFFKKSDVWSNINGRYDYIYANPPYISKRRNTAEESVTEFEPLHALFAEEDGYAFIKKTIDGLPKFLANKGTCWIEHEPFHIMKIHEQLSEINFQGKTEKDQYGLERYTRIARQGMA